MISSSIGEISTSPRSHSLTPPRHEVAALVASTTPSLDEQDAGVGFLDDGRPLDRRARKHVVATPHRDIPPAAGKPDLSLADGLAAVTRFRSLGQA